MANIYNVIYRGNFCSPDGTDNVIEFSKRMLDTDPVPVVTPIIFAGHEDEPITFEFQDKGDYKQEPINGLSMTVNIKAIETFELQSLYTADEREWQVTLTGTFNVTGWLIPDSCSEPYASKPYDVSVQITDAVGTLEDVPFAKSDGVTYKGFYSDIQLVQICLAKTGLELPLLTGINTYEVTMDRAFGPLQQCYRDTARYLDADGNPFSCLEVLRSILEHWSARLHQWNGYWQIVNVLEKSTGNVKAWRYTTQGTTDSFVTLGNTIISGGINRDLQPTDANDETAKAFKLSTAYYQYGYPSNALLNGDFDDAIPPALPNHWVASDGGSAHSETRIDETTGLATTDHYLVIDSNGSGGGFIYNNTTVQVRANQKVVVSFDLLSYSAVSALGRRYLGLRLSDNFGNFYTAANGWVQSGNFYVIDYQASDFSNQIRVNFEISQQPYDYQLTIGLQAVAGTAGTEFSTRYNNVSIQPQTVSGQTAPPLGVFNRETLKAPQTYKKDPILLLHGDETNPQRTSRLSIGSAITITPPTFWERSGIVEPISGLPERQSLLHIVANTELRNHQRPYLTFTAKFVGFGYIDINTLLVVDLLSPTGWIFLSGKFDIKTGYHTLRFAEVLVNEPNYVEEFNIEDYGSEKGVEGLSVGQPDSITTQPGTSYIDLSGFATTDQIPVKASAVETAAGTNDDKFVTPFKLLGWWTNIKTLAATISGLWNFTTRPTYNGSNLLTAADIPAETDTLDSVLSRGNISAIGAKMGYLILNSATPDIVFDQVGGSGYNTFLFYRNGVVKMGVGRDAADDFYITRNVSGSYFDDTFKIVRLTGKASFGYGLSVDVAPVNPNDVVRLQELNAFKGSDTVLTKSSAYTVVLADFGSNGNVTIYVDTTSGNVSITLPSAGVMNGYTANIIKTSSDVNSVVVTATINGITNDLLASQFDAGTYKSNGASIFKF